MSNDTREALAAARSALGQLIEAGKAVKAALDATIPDGEPVHPESRRLTWPISSGLLALDAVDAALATQPAQPSAELSVRAVEELLQLGYTVKDDLLYPPVVRLKKEQITKELLDGGTDGAPMRAFLEAEGKSTTPAQPSAQGEAVAHPSHQTVSDWMPVNEALRLADVWSVGDLDNCGQWRAAIKVLADEVRALASAPAAPEQRQADERGDMAMREWHRECNDADEILRMLGLEPSAFRTDGGSLNLPRIRIAIVQRDQQRTLTSELGSHPVMRALTAAAITAGLGPAPAAPAQAVPLTDEQIDSLRGLDTASRVRFYEHDYYVLSNFSAFTLVWKGIRFDTSEAAYHFEKFSDCDGAMADVRSIQWDIRTAPSAHEAFKIAERNRAHRRPDWDDVKVGIMLDILRAKAEQHEYVRRKLLTTGDRELVEDSWRDDFWGWGPNRDGKNMLGRLWMQVRSELHGIAPKAAQPQEKT